MSFYPVHSSHHAGRDEQQQPLHACDDLEIIDEQHLNLDTDRDSLTHHIKDNTPQLTQHNRHYADVDEHKEASPSPSSLSAPSAAILPHLSTAFPFHSPFHAHKHNKSSSSICSLPASPTDVSNEHGSRGGAGGPGSRRVSRLADPATLFLLHRIMKGDVFTLYTPSPSSPDSFNATPVFVFYDAHGRLGSLYWTAQRKHGARQHTIHEDDDSDTRAASSSTLSATHFVRHLSPSHCLPIHSLAYVGHGKPSILLPTLTSSPLSSACFLTLQSSSRTLYLSHNEASVVRQWVACLRDIFVQNGHDVRDADCGELADSPHKGTRGMGKAAAGLLNLFAEPLDGSDEDSGNGSGRGSGSGGGDRANSLVDSDSGKRSSLSVSEKSADCDLLDKRKQRKDSMAMCQCTIC